MKVLLKRCEVDECYARMAKLMSARATCTKTRQGAVIVDKENYILSLGFNGAPKGLEHCEYDFEKQS